MKTYRQANRCRALTLVEVIVLIVVVGLLGLVLLPAISRTTAQAHRIRCVSNLKNLGLAYRVFAVDRFASRTNLATNAPEPLRATLSTDITAHLARFSNYLNTPVPLICPADKRRPAPSFSQLRRENISYFFAPETSEDRPSDLLAGDRNLTLNGTAVGPGVLAVARGDRLGWTGEMHGPQGNVLLADGSVQQFPSNRLAAALQASSRETNRWLVP